MGNIIGFNPCRYCKEQRTRCKMCELQMYRDGIIKNSDWISVDERLPKQWEMVLVCCDDIISTDFIASTGRWFEHIDHTSVTHWMPLPEAPKMKGGAE